MLTAPTTKRSRPIFPYRSAAAGAQPTITACRAWRIIARPASDFAAAQPAVTAGDVSAAPSGTLDGVYPVWVRLTDPSGQAAAHLVLVEGDGWNTAPTGPDWRIEHVGLSGTAADRFAYIVETVQDVAECGQVNAPAAESLARRVVLFDRTYAVGQAPSSTVLVPGGAWRALEVESFSGGAGSGTVAADLWVTDETGALRFPTGYTTWGNATANRGSVLIFGRGGGSPPNNAAVFGIPVPAGLYLGGSAPTVGTLRLRVIAVRS